jgi:ketosteroid isomerase-like protein
MQDLGKLTVAAVLSFALAGTANAAAATAARTPAAGPAPAAKPTGPSDHARIEALEKGFRAAFEAKDVNRIMSYYARQGLFVFDVTPPREHVGWQSYKEDWQELFKVYPGPVKVDLTDLSVTVVGNVAYGHSIQDGHFGLKDGSTIELVVRVTDVYRKIAGKWLIVQEHVSVPVDLATMKPDVLSKP